MFIKIQINEVPKPQPRTKATNRGGFIRMYTPDTADDWKKAVKGALLIYTGLDKKGPVALEASFYLPRPQSLYRKKDPDNWFPHIKKPDLDNLLKSTMDAITDVNVWHDDSQVYVIVARKVYVGKDEVPHANITIAFEGETDE